MTAHLSSSARDKSLDGLRGLAATGIVIYHAHYGGILNWLWVGVDIFFVLSGFLIGRIILGGIRMDSFSWRTFIIRRILRIWPVYYLVLVFCSAVVILNFFLTGKWEHADGLFSAPFFLQFTHHYLEPGMRGMYDDFIIWFHHSWSLAVEEQFYLLLPAFLLAFRNRPHLCMVLIMHLILTAVILRGINVFPLLLVARMDALFIGVLIAFYWVNFEESGIPGRKGLIMPKHAAVIAVIGVMLLVGGLWKLMEAGREPGFGMGQSIALLGFNCLIGCLILSLVKGWLDSLRRLLESKVLVFLGSISYALYMMHVPLRGVLLNLVEEPSISIAPLWLQGTYFAGSVLIAYLSKIWLEDPISGYKKRYQMVATE